MKRKLVFLFIYFLLAATIAHAQTLPEDVNTASKEQAPFIASYLQDLEELGYCVIPNILSTVEAELLYQRVWHEFIEKAWPNCKLNDRSNWNESFPMHNKKGVFAGPAGQIQVMWDLRQDPRIVDVFAKVWNTNDLIVSMDGMSLMCPPEIREGNIVPWPHVDQRILRRQNNEAYGDGPPVDFVSESLLKTQPYSVQGMFLFEDSFEGDGGFYCIPKSHLIFNEFAPQLETISAISTSGDELVKIRNEFLEEFFEGRRDESGNPYCKKQIEAPRGSLILWDSRTIHWNQHANKDRPYSDNPKVRMVGYLCYVPKSRLLDEGRRLRISAFENGISTTHSPNNCIIRPTKGFIHQEFMEYLEDPSYIHPKINLTALGESVLGIR